MTHNEKWMVRYKDVIPFIETNYRNPSKYSKEEKMKAYFLKYCRKIMNAGELKESWLWTSKEILD